MSPCWLLPLLLVAKKKKLLLPLRLRQLRLPLLPRLLLLKPPLPLLLRPLPLPRLLKKRSSNQHPPGFRGVDAPKPVPLRVLAFLLGQEITMPKDMAHAPRLDGTIVAMVTIITMAKPNEKRRTAITVRRLGSVQRRLVLAAQALANQEGGQ